MFDRTVDRMIKLYLKRNKRRPNKIKKKTQFIVTASNNRRRPFVRRLSLHPRGHILPPERNIAAHTGEHFLRNGNLKHCLQSIFTIEIWTEFPHEILLVVPVCVGMHCRELQERNNGEREREGAGNVGITIGSPCL